MPAPSFVASGTEVSGVGAITPPLPVGWAAGHYLLLKVETANQAVSAPAGWTEVPNSPQSTGTAGAAAATRLHVFGRIAQSGDTAPTVADSGDHQIGWITAFSGVDGTTPVLHSAGSVLSSAGQTGTATGFTTTRADLLIVMIGTHAIDLNDDAACSVANANLTSVTVRKTFNTTAGNGGCLVLATGIRAATGNIGSTTFEWSNSADGQPIVDVQAMLILALQEPVGTPAQVHAITNGNSSSGATWNTGTPPLPTQDVFANGFNVTVDTSTEWKSSSTLAGTLAVAGGSFILSNGVTLTLNGGLGNATAGPTTCVTFSGTTGQSATLVGNPIGSASTGSRYGANNSSTGTFNVIGNPVGGAAGSAIGAANSGTGTMNVTGAPVAGAGSASHGARNLSTGTLNVNGNPVGGAGTAVHYAAGGGTITGAPTASAGNIGTVVNAGAGTVTITGSVVGGSAANANGVTNSGTGTVIVNSDAIGGTNATAFGASNTGSGTLTVLGKAISNIAPGVNGSTTGNTTVGAAETGAACIAPITGKVVFANLNTATFGIRNAAGTLQTLSAGTAKNIFSPPSIFGAV